MTGTGQALVSINTLRCVTESFHLSPTGPLSTDLLSWDPERVVRSSEVRQSASSYAQGKATLG